MKEDDTRKLRVIENDCLKDIGRVPAINNMKRNDVCGLGIPGKISHIYQEEESERIWVTWYAKTMPAMSTIHSIMTLSVEVTEDDTQSDGMLQ